MTTSGIGDGSAKDDDDMELINAEFESMVADLNLDQSSPRTYLDELDEIAQQEKAISSLPPRTSRGLHGSITHFISAIQRWWRRGDTNESDGAIV
jgi:hypothetical protein